MKPIKKRRKRQKGESVTFGSVTVKVYTRLRTDAHGKGHRVWELDAAGNRRMFHDHDAAVAEAKRIAKLRDKGEALAANIDSRHAAAYGRCVQLLRETGVPIELAVAKFVKAWKVVGDRFDEVVKDFKARHPDRPNRKVSEVVTELVAHRRARGKSPRYLEDLENRLTKFSKNFAVNIDRVFTSDVQGWLDKLKVKTQTVRNYQRVLNTLFEFAISRGYVPKNENPVADTEKVDVRNGEIEIYTPKELRALLDAEPKEEDFSPRLARAFKPCIALAAFAGLRTAEIERLTWDDIDFASGHITLSASKAKTASRRIIPIVPALRAWLEPFARKHGPVWPGKRDEFYDAQRPTAQTAGIAWKRNGLRHSFASYRLAEVKNAAQVSLEMGNSAGVVFKFYRELVTPKQAEEWFGVMPVPKENVTTLPMEARI
jgi:integrase